MSLIVKDKSISRKRQQAGYAWEFANHAHEFRYMWRASKLHKNSKRITLRTHRTGK